MRAARRLGGGSAPEAGGRGVGAVGWAAGTVPNIGAVRGEVGYPQPARSHLVKGGVVETSFN